MLPVIKKLKPDFTLLFSFIISFAFLFIIQCSSDDDSDKNGGENNSLLNGTYFMSHIGGSDSLYNQVNMVDFNGEGTYESTIEYDSSGDTGNFSGAYSVSSDYILIFTGSDSESIVSANGDIFTIIDTKPSGVDEDIYLGISIKTSSGMSAADLNGDYVFCQIRHDGERTKTARFEITFDGAGNFSGTQVDDTDSGTTSVQMAGTYTVAGNGAFTFSATGLSKTFIGHVSHDGSLIAIQDAETPNDGEVLIMTGLKKTSGADESLLSGNYRMYMLLGGSDDSNWTTNVSVTADGAGNLNSTVLADSDGDPGTYNMTYTVNSDGTITIDEGNDAGIISQNGEMFILANTGDSSGDVTFGIGIKKIR